jgi:hypothetical protein
MGEIQASSVLPELTLTLRKVGLRFVFKIQQDGVDYEARENFNTRQIFITYESLNPYLENPVRIGRSPLFNRLKGLPIVYLIMAAATGAITVYASILFICCSLLTIVALVVARLTGWTDVRLKSLPLVGPVPGAWGPLTIIDGPKGQKVLDAIKAAWQAKLKRLYGSANLAGDADKEISRLTWLRDNHILSDAELNLQIDRVKQASVQYDPTIDRAH